MDKERKLALIDKFEDLSYGFDDVLELSDTIIDYKPFPDAWSIKEQIIHCLDFDAANFHRYRWGIAGPGSRVLSFDQTWTEKLDYRASDIRLGLELIKLIRKFMAAHLRTIADEDWSAYGYILGEERKFNLEEALQLYIDHVGFHRKLIDRNIEIFKITRDKK